MFVEMSHEEGEKILKRLLIITDNLHGDFGTIASYGPTILVTLKCGFFSSG